MNPNLSPSCLYCSLKSTSCRLKGIAELRKAGQSTLFRCFSLCVFELAGFVYAAADLICWRVNRSMFTYCEFNALSHVSKISSTRGRYQRPYRQYFRVYSSERRHSRVDDQTADRVSHQPVVRLEVSPERAMIERSNFGVHYLQPATKSLTGTIR